MSAESDQEATVYEIEQQVENTIDQLRDIVSIGNDNIDDQTDNDLNLSQDVRESLANGEVGAAWLFAKMINITDPPWRNFR